MERRGRICRIRKCVFDLLSMEGELIEEDEDGWELMASDLRLKSTFLYCDLNQVIADAGDDGRKRFLTDLANRLFYSIEELDLAVKSRSISMTQIQYKDAIDILREVMAALMPLHQAEMND